MEDDEPDAEDEQRGKLVLKTTLLLERKVSIDLEALRGAFAKHCGPVIALPVRGDGGEERFFTFDGEEAIAASEARLLGVSVLDGPEITGSTGPSVEQTWSWPGAQDAVERHRARVVVSEIAPNSQDRALRLERWNGLLRSLVELTPCLALNWITSQKMLDPVEWLAALEGPEATPLLGALNVRLFNVMERTQGELVMDTLGLEIFDLPDLQLHFTGLEPPAVAGLLYGCGAYLFEEGDVIKDGHTIQGLEKDQRWRAQHEVSLVGPERPVIDFDPGPPFAAGERSPVPKKRVPSTRATRARRLGRRRRREP